MLPRLESESDYRELLERAGDMIYVIDLEGHFTFTNPAIEEAGGWEPGELIGRHFLDVVAPDSRASAIDHFRRGVAGLDVPPFIEVEALRKDGTTFEIETRAGSLYRDGELVGRYGIARDITELKHLQSEVHEKSRRLAMMEDQARAAMDLYRQIAELTLGASSDTAAAFRGVQSSLATAKAAKLGLSARDLRIVELLSEGCSNAEIGEDLHLSPNTVKDHVSKIMGRLGARRRAEVVGRAARAGLIAPES